jgi:hypothetical protein
MNSGVIVKSSWNAGEDAGIAPSSTRIYMRRIPFSALPGVLHRKYLLIPVKGKTERRDSDEHQESRKEDERDL